MMEQVLHYTHMHCSVRLPASLRPCCACHVFMHVHVHMLHVCALEPRAGPLQQPRGQHSVLYEVPPEPTARDVAAARAQYSRQPHTAAGGGQGQAGQAQRQDGEERGDGGTTSQQGGDDARSC